MIHLCLVVKPLPMKYVSAKLGKRGGPGGHGNSNKSSMKDQEKMLVSYCEHLRRKDAVMFMLYL